MNITQRLGVCVVVLATVGALIAAPALAQSVPLFPAQVSEANIDCIFGTQCAAVTPHDETTDIPLPAISGKAILQSRTFEGTPGSKAPGRTAYQYRIDLSDARTLSDASCLTNLSVDFGPVVKLPYAPGPTLRDVYEIKVGAPPNQIGFSKVEQTGEVVTFTFPQPLCAGEGTSPGATTFFFGLASSDPPVRGGRVVVDVLGTDNVPVKSFSPRR